MKYGPMFGWGAVIYALVFLLSTGFLTYEFVEGVAPRIVGTIAVCFFCIVAGRALRLRSALDILPYSLVWGVMMGLFDIIFMVPYAGWEYFSNPNAWFGYAIVALAPLLSPYIRVDSLTRSTYA